MEDANNRGRLAKLVRFHTTKSPTALTSLDEYVARMKGGQKHIFFICGASMDEVQKSPFLERLIEQDLEVILFTEPMDEYMMQARLRWCCCCRCLACKLACPACTRNACRQGCMEHPSS